MSQQLPTYQAAMMQEELPLRTSITPAMAIGGSLETVNNFSALAQIAFVVFMRFRGRRVRASE
jgi:hypothetical protein